MRNAVQEIRGAVERIDDPAMRCVGAVCRSALLAEEAVTGARLRELVAQHLLRAVVRGGDEISRSFERDLQTFDLAEIALEPARGFLRGTDHHVQERGLDHDVRVSAEDVHRLNARAPE